MRVRKARTERRQNRPHEWTTPHEWTPASPSGRHHHRRQVPRRRARLAMEGEKTRKLRSSRALTRRNPRLKVCYTSLKRQAVFSLSCLIFTCETCENVKVMVEDKDPQTSHHLDVVTESKNPRTLQTKHHQTKATRCNLLAIGLDSSARYRHFCRRSL